MSPKTQPQTPNRKLFIATVTIGMLLLTSLLLEAHVIRKSAAGTALWNSREAYFFIAQTSRGFHVKWLAYPLLLLGSRMGHVQLPSEDRGDLHVIHVSAAGVETRVVNVPDRSQGSGPKNYTPIEGRIWAHYPAIGGLCWWAGDHFEPATQEERRKIDLLRDLRRYTYEDRKGWSFRLVVGATLQIKLEGGVNSFV